MKRVCLTFLLAAAVVPPVAAASSDTVVTFNEIMYHPLTNEPAMEWVELYNQLSVDVDLSGWRLDRGIDFRFPTGTLIHGRGYLVVAADPAALSAATGVTGLLGPFTNRLGNAGDTIELKNNNNRLMDSVSYLAEFDWPVAADGAGPSLAKLRPTAPSGEAASWTASRQSGGTPGTTNFVPAGTFTAPPGLVSFWDFNSTNFLVRDLAGGNHGLPGAGVTHVGGLAGSGALAFDATTNAFVTVGPGVANNLAVRDGLTLEALLRPGWSGTGTATIFRKEEPDYGTLVSYWSFDEAAAGTLGATDPVTGNHGSFLGTATRTTGLAGLGAARFNNTGTDAVAVGAGVSGSFSMSTGITVFARLRPQWSGSSGDYDEIFRKEDGDRRILLSFQNDANNGGASPPVAAGPVLSFGLNVGGAYTELDMPLDGVAGRPTLAQLKDGTTHSVAATYDSSTGLKALWIDGTMRWSTTLTGTISSGGGAIAVIGNTSTSGGEAFTGTIDEVAVWRAALTTNDLAALAGGAVPSTLGANPDPAASRRLLLAFQNDGHHTNANPPVAAGPALSFGLNVGGTYSELDLPLDGADGRPTLAQLEDGGLHHLAASYDQGTGLKAIYLDGTLRFSNLLSGAISNGGTGLAILGNAAAGGSEPFVGLLDEVAFWSRALTPTEVARHFEAAQMGRDYFTDLHATNGSLGGGDAPHLAFNELASATNAEFWLELINYGTTDTDLNGCVLARLGGTNREYLLPALTLSPGALVQITRATLGFGVDSGDRLILYAPDHTTVLDAVVAKKDPRARHPDATGAWLFPSALTPGASNAFASHQEVVINEIMYHHRPVPATPAVFSETNLVVAFTNAWRYHAQGLDLGTAWREPAYDDSAWPEGAAVLHNSPSTLPVTKNTLMSATNAAGQRIITYYFRTPFTWTGASNPPALSLRTLIDDGAIFYLNGSEVLRQNMPADPITASTVASTGVGVAKITGPFALPATSLVEGLNVLAVEVHRISTVDNDVVFGAELSAAAQLSPALPRHESAESWVELFNRSTNTVDLTGWRLDEGIDYRFAPGQTLAPGGYLVVAKDVALMRSLYPRLEVVGPFTNKLSKSGDLLVLKDEHNNPVNTVRYGDGGRWPEAANGGGSSLELRDPWADNTQPEVWAASDEGSKSQWAFFTNRAVAVAGLQPATAYHELVLGLLDAGECLLDDLRVVESPTNTPISLLQNGTFTSGLTAWRILGNQRGSLATDPTQPGNNVLRLLADGPTEYLHNHAETTLKNGSSYYGLFNGRQYEVSFRAKWISGNNRLNTRLWMNRLPRTFELPVPPLNGTPGARNSRLESNLGPTCSNLRHSRTVPLAGEPVNVEVEAADPQGVAALTLCWSVNSGPWQTVAMTETGVRRVTHAFAGTIPGASARAVVNFFVQATDTLGALSQFPSGGTNSRALYQVEDGRALLTLANNLRLIMTPADSDYLLQATNLMSNSRLGATVIWNEEEVYYDLGLRLKGSEHGRPDANRLGFFVDFRQDQLFRGIHSSLGVDRSGGWRFGATFGQDEIVIKHLIAHAGGLPQTYDDLIRVLTPRDEHTGSAILQMARYGDVFLNAQYQNGGDGTVFEYDLLYDASATSTGGPEGIKVPQEGSTVGVALGDLGADRENYRLDFIIKNNRDADDYTGLITALQAIGLPAGGAFDAATSAALDVDEWLRAYALSSLCGPGDNYGGDNSMHNLLLYTRPEDHKTLFFIWDTDFAFVRPATDPIAVNTDLNKFIANAANRRRYYGHLLDIISTTYNTAYMSYWTDHYDNFLPGQDFSSILTYIGQRAEYVLSQLPTQVPFAITTHNGQDFTTDTNLVTLTGTAPLQVNTLEVNGVSYPITWTSVTNWFLTLPLFTGGNRLSLLGRDRAGQDLTNCVAALTVTNTGPGALLPIVINEWMADNAGPGGFPDPLDGLFSDWFELFNPNTNAVSLGGFFLTDNLTLPSKWPIPSGTVIAPRGFLLVWADNCTNQNGLCSGGDLHANFQLSAGGEAIGLYSPSGVLQHAVTFGPQIQNVSQGLFPDGATDAIYPMTNWTPRAANTLAALTAPRLLSLDITNEIITLACEVMPGRTYQLQYKNDLAAPAWTLAPFAPPQRATSPRLTLTDLLDPTAPTRFYRVLLLP